MTRIETRPYYPVVIRRRVLLPLGLAALALYAWLAVQVYRAQADPEGFAAWDGRYAWIVGPPAGALNDAAARHIEAGLTTLGDTTLSPADRIDRFHEHLRIAEDLLVRSLRAQPAQAHALSRLATVRWELDPPFTEEAQRRHLELIDLASRMAPNVPAVQMELGRVLLLMGRRAEALDYLGHVVALAPDLSRDVVALMTEHQFRAAEMLAALPRSPETLAALRPPFESEGRTGEYIQILAAAFAADPSSAALLRSYGAVALRAGHAEAMIGFLDSLGPLDDPVIEAMRLSQRSRARLALDDPVGAVKDARRARALQPDEPRYGESLGDAALAAGAPDEAIEAFRQTLAQVARRSGSPDWRARLYRKTGEAEERAGRRHDAYDSYKKALALDPDEPVAARRVEEIEAAAGVRP